MRPARLQGAPQPRARHATLVEALRRAAASGRRGLTFVSADETETALGWDEVLARAARVAGALADLGVRPGERVAMVLPTGPEFMDAFFGALLAGAVPVPLYPPVRLGRLAEYHATTARMLRLSGAVVLLSDGRVARLLGEAVRRSAPRLGLRNVQALRESDAPPVAMSADPGGLALVQFSSGSTVDPKPVALSHRAVLAQTDALRALMQLDQRLDQRQAEPEPSVRTRQLILRLHEGGEEPCEELGGDPTSIVPDPELGNTVRPDDLHHYRPAPAPVTSGILEQVADHLRDARLVALDPDRPGRQALDGDSSILEERFVVLAGALRDLDEVDALGVKTDHPSLDPGQIEQVVDEMGQLSGLTLDDRPGTLHLAR